jgi:hypothetical protein
MCIHVVEIPPRCHDSVARMLRIATGSPLDPLGKSGASPP